MTVAVAALLLAHAATTLAMTGVIWFVQLVHYPLFALVGADGAVAYSLAHQSRTARLVVPLMLGEAVAAAALPFVVTAASRPWALAGLLLLGVVWLSTALLQVPLHRRLAAAADPAAVRRLVRSNWIRTVAWSLRSLVAIALLVPGPGGG